MEHLLTFRRFRAITITPTYERFCLLIQIVTPPNRDVNTRGPVSEMLPHDELSRVWKTTAQLTANSPVYEEFIDGVRAVSFNSRVNCLHDNPIAMTPPP